MRSGVACFASCLFALCFAGPAAAAEKGLPKGAAQWMAIDNCAAYGPGFASVEGTSSCVRIGGHVRVGIGARNLGYEVGNAHASATDAVIRTNDISGVSDRHLRVGASDPYAYNP